jgi:hypothetical protein
MMMETELKCPSCERSLGRVEMMSAALLRPGAWVTPVTWAFLGRNGGRPS